MEMVASSNDAIHTKREFEKMDCADVCKLSEHAYLVGICKITGYNII